MGVCHTQPIPMGVDNLWPFLPGKYGNVLTGKTGTGKLVVNPENQQND